MWYSLFGPLSGILTTKFVRQNPRADIIMMFNFADCEDKCHGQAWRFPMTGGYKLVTQLSNYTSCMLYDQLMAVHFGSTILTSDRMLLRILAASTFLDNY